jgi:DNA polymerase kappa
MMLAKVASDMNKPNGQFTVAASREAVLEFVQKLPIRKISGIGKVTESMLNALSVTMCRDLYQQRAVLQLLFSQSSSSHFLRVCLGLGSTHVHREYSRKSMSTQRTFAEVSEPSQLQQKCLELCKELAGDMERDAIMGRTVGVILKTVSFKVKTKTVTLPQPVSLAEQLHSAASGLLETEIRACAPNPLRLRLMGVRISSLQSREQSEQRGGSSGEGRGKQETLDVFVQQQPTLPTFPATSAHVEADVPVVCCLLALSFSLPHT